MSARPAPHPDEGLRPMSHGHVLWRHRYGGSACAVVHDGPAEGLALLLRRSVGRRIVLWRIQRGDVPRRAIEARAFRWRWLWGDFREEWLAYAVAERERGARDAAAAERDRFLALLDDLEPAPWRRPVRT